MAQLVWCSVHLKSAELMCQCFELAAARIFPGVKENLKRIVVAQIFNVVVRMNDVILVSVVSLASSLPQIL